MLISLVLQLVEVVRELRRGWWLPAMKGIEETATSNEDATPPTEVTIATTPSRGKKPTIHQQRKQALADFLNHIVAKGDLKAEDLPFTSVALLKEYNQQVPNLAINVDDINGYIDRAKPVMRSTLGVVDVEFSRDSQSVGKLREILEKNPYKIQ